MSKSGIEQHKTLIPSPGHSRANGPVEINRDQGGLTDGSVAISDHSDAYRVPAEFVSLFDPSLSLKIQA
jgi:hypothetical protein